MSGRCESTSPIYKFDEGPRQCRGEKGHAGKHWAYTSDGRYVEQRYDYQVTWEDPASNQEYTKMTTEDIARDGMILLSTVGSSAHGLALEGTDDRDEMGICIEPAEYVIGLKHFEQHVFRSKPVGVRSEAGDTDRTVYSARKFCRLALNGNPSILTLLFAKPDKVTAIGQSLLDLTPAFVARSAGRAFLGYATQQRQRLLGERGQMNVKRPELTEKYGWDTKYAMHMLRLGYQGVEFLETGRMTLPMLEPQRSFIRSVRVGEVDLNEVLTIAGELEQKISDLIDTSPLPPTGDYEKVNQWLVAAHQSFWGEEST